MKKLIFPLTLLLVLFAFSVNAAQRVVLAELMTANWCPY